VVRDAARLRRRLNMASGRPSFLWSLRVGEIVAFYGRLYGLSGQKLRRRVDELIELCELGANRRTPYSELSTGLKQRVALAKSLVNDPELLFLDEPTLGLDPDVSVRVRRPIAELRSQPGITIVLTTHYMREADALCDEIAFIKVGRILAPRNVFFFFQLLFWPIVGVLSIGLMTRFLHLTPAEASFVLIGTIALSIVNVCQLEVAYAVLLDVWSKSLKHQFLAPIGIRHLTFGSWLVGMARGGVLFLLLAALGWWAFDFRVLAPGWLAVATFVLGCFLNAWIVGVFVCALIALFGNRAEAFAWASVNLVLVLAGLYYPVSVLPEPVGMV